MVVDYKNVEWTKAEHFKGGENFIWLKVKDDGQNKIVLMKIPTGSTVGYHKHEGSCETMYFLEGTGEVMDGEELIPVHAGMMHYCAEGCAHQVINNSGKDLILFAVIPNFEFKKA